MNGIRVPVVGPILQCDCLRDNLFSRCDNTFVDKKDRQTDRQIGRP